MERYHIQSIEELPAVAKKILLLAGDCRIFAFIGPMGSGKTTLIKQMCIELGTIDDPVSPTFSIVNEYHTHKEGSIFHFDFYRIKSMNEVLDIGYEEYFFSDSYCFIEWPELIQDVLPDRLVVVQITEEEDRSRTIEAMLEG